MRALPSHGFTAGLFGQRDRALLVLTQIAGLSYRSTAALTPGDLRHEYATGTVSIAIGSRARAVEPAGDAATCPACALTRWLRTIAVMTRYVATQPLVDHLRSIDPVIDTTVHDCGEPTPAVGALAPLLPPVNQWGHVPFPPTQLSVQALSRQTRDEVAPVSRTVRVGWW